VAVAETIDFTRKDFGGSWLLFLCIVVPLLTQLNKAKLTGGYREATRAILTRLALGVLLAVPLVILFEAWVRWPSRQYFVSLRWEADHVVLGYRWPKADVTIPVRNIVRLSTIRRGGRRGGNQVVIETATETIRSSGFGTLAEGEQLLWKKLHAAVGPRQENLSPPAPVTNAPVSNALP